MVCYAPRAGTIIGAGITSYVLFHKVIGRILHIAGLVMEIALIASTAAAAAVLVAWAAQTISRRRAALGACTTCRFRCQRAMTPHPPVPVIRTGHPAATTAAGRAWYKSSLGTEILKQGVEHEFLLDADVAVPHGGGEFRVPRRRSRLADEPSERRQRMDRRHRSLVGLTVVPPRPPVNPVTHRMGDPDATPVEVAVVTELRAAGRE